MKEMKEQMQTLRQTIQNERLVTDKILKNSMQQKMSWINRYVRNEIIAVPFIILLWIEMAEDWNLSWWSFGMMVVMLIVSALFDYRINVTALKSEDYQRGNLLNTLGKLVNMKRYRILKRYIMFPLLVIWLLWVAAEVWINNVSSADGWTSPAYVGAGIVIIGGILGLVISINITRKMQRSNDELIEQIKSYTQQ